MLIAYPLGICLLLLIGIQSITYLCLWIKPALETIQILVTSFKRTLLISVVNIYKGTDDTNAQFNYQMISKHRGCFVILFFYIFLFLVLCILVLFHGILWSFIRFPIECGIFSLLFVCGYWAFCACVERKRAIKNWFVLTETFPSG